MSTTDQTTTQDQPLVAHLIELRDRVLRMVLVVLAVFLVLFPFANDIYIWVASPLMRHLPEGTSMIATEVASPFLTPFKLSLVAAVFMAMPFILYQFWAFVAPGLYKHEKKLVMPLLVSSPITSSATRPMSDNSQKPTSNIIDYIRQDPFRPCPSPLAVRSFRG